MRGGPSKPHGRIPEFGQSRHLIRTVEKTPDQFRATVGAKCSHESFALFVLAHLGIEAENLVEHSSRSTGLLTSSPEDIVESVVIGDEVLGCHVHHDLAMSLKNAHEGTEATKGIHLAFACDETGCPDLFHRVPPLGDLPQRANQCPKKIRRSRGEGTDNLLDEPQKVGTYPGRARELSTVGRLMERKPQSELTRIETVTALKSHDVGAHVADDVFVNGSLLADEDVILTKHPARHPRKHRGELGR
jgi:hypothetical protein